MNALPPWSRALGAGLVLLLVNLLWNHPLREVTGGGAMAFFALNLLPSTVALAWISLGGAPQRR